MRVVDGSILGWLLLTCTNVARNLTRSRRRYGALLARLPRTEEHHDPTAEVVDRIDQAALDSRTRAARNGLPARDREVLVLCLVEGYSATAAATVLGVPTGTVTSRLARARARARLSKHITARPDDLYAEESHDT